MLECSSTPEYLYATLTALRDGRRASGFMQSAVSGLTGSNLQVLTQHYGSGAKIIVGRARAAHIHEWAPRPGAARRSDPFAILQC